MTLPIKLDPNYIDKVVSNIPDALTLLKKGIDKNYRHVSIALKKVCSGSYYVVLNAENFGAFDDITLVRIMLNEDLKTGGYMLSYFLSKHSRDSLELEFEKELKKHWKRVFGVDI